MDDDTKPKPPGLAKGGLPYTGGFRNVTRMPGSPPPVEPEMGTFPESQQHNEHQAPGAVTITRPVKGVYINVTFTPQKDELQEDGETLAAVSPSWIVEGLGNFVLKETLFIPKRLLLEGDAWTEEAFQQIRPALIASLEMPPGQK